MLGAGKNLNQNVSAIKMKFISHIVNIGEGLGQIDEQNESDLLFTEKKPTNAKKSKPAKTPNEPNFEGSNGSDQSKE